MQHFFGAFPKNIEILNFTAIHSEGAELLHADRQTDGHMDGQTGMKKLIVAFGNSKKSA